MALYAIYLFLVDRAYIVSGSTKSRLKSKLYLWNTFGMLGLYGVIGILDFVYRIAYIRDGQCIYLTGLFLKPLMNTYSIRRKLPPPPVLSGGDAALQAKPLNSKLRKLAIRTVIGCVSTLLISMAEVVWLFIATSIIIHWVTLPDDLSKAHSSCGPSCTETSLTDDPERETKSRTLSIPTAPP
ncbi:hypothetical protein E8E14_011086 [Neopestalotiopsis sp. 37M]|nr:hypothetical protein E8E14_011086 [Neopestalotiopsis sp. 37M]